MATPTVSRLAGLPSELHAKITGYALANLPRFEVDTRFDMCNKRHCIDPTTTAPLLEELKLRLGIMQVNRDFRGEAQRVLRDEGLTTVVPYVTPLRELPWLVREYTHTLIIPHLGNELLQPPGNTTRPFQRRFPKLKRLEIWTGVADTLPIMLAELPELLQTRNEENAATLNALVSRIQAIPRKPDQCDLIFNLYSVVWWSDLEHSGFSPRGIHRFEIDAFNPERRKSYIEPILSDDCTTELDPSRGCQWLPIDEGLTLIRKGVSTPTVMHSPANVYRVLSYDEAEIEAVHVQLANEKGPLYARAFAEKVCS